MFSSTIAVSSLSRLPFPATTAIIMHAPSRVCMVNVFACEHSRVNGRVCPRVRCAGESELACVNTLHAPMHAFTRIYMQFSHSIDISLSLLLLLLSCIRSDG